MLIVCPSCATSYMIDEASLGVGGRMVRCARCKATWFASRAQEEAIASVDEANFEAEAESVAPEPFLRAPPEGGMSSPRVDDFGTDPAESFGPADGQPVEPSAPAAASEIAHTEPEIIADAPSLVPPMEQAPAVDAGSEHGSDSVETFAARRQRLKSRRKQAKRSSRWTAVILVLFAVNVAVIGGRSEVVRYLPQTASLFAAIGLPVNLQHLKFENVRISPSGTNDEGLTVEGTIVSTASAPIKVPDLRFAARNAAGQEIYTWTARPSRTSLDPGQKLDFRSELTAPPANAKDVLVRFFTVQETANMSAGAITSNTIMKPGAMTPGQSGGVHQPDQ